LEHRTTVHDPITVLVVDNDERVRQGLRQRMERTAGIRVAGVARIDDDVPRLVRELAPDVVLLDLRGHNGAALALCREVSALVPVLILSSYLTQEEWEEARAAGALDFHLKQIGFAGLVDKIRAVTAARRNARRQG
jgi:DNA-binding NarL/FixJ family response regulator